MNRTRQMKRYGLQAGLALAGIVWFGNTAQGADVLFAPVAATAQSYYSGGAGLRASFMSIDGSGMTPNNPVTASSTAGNGAAYTMWLSDNTTNTWITFDLGSVRTVTGFHLWNYNELGMGTVEPYRGVRTAGIYTGTNLLAAGSSYAAGGAAWGTLVTNMTFESASATAADAGRDYTFDAPVTTRYLQLYVTANFPGADLYAGIAEIRFYALPQYTVTPSSSGSAYAVSGTDLLQTHLGFTVDALNLNDFSTYNIVNGGAAALTDGLFGPANSWEGSCQLNGGLVTYFLNTADHPAGYTITNINTYSGWQDSGRRNQNYTVSFRKAGSDTFGDAIAVSYEGTANQTSISITDLGLTGVDAIRFTFPGQQAGGVGYKEFDVFGSVPTYAAVTRLDSGVKVIANDETSNVLITEGTGVSGDITLGAAATIVRSLTQGTTAGIATINPAGQALSLWTASICSPTRAA